MDKLKETWGQIRDLYAGMPTGTRIVAGLLVAVLLVSLVFLVMPGKGTPSAAKEIFLYGDYEFSPGEQRAVIDALGSAGLRDHRWEGFRLKVPAKKSELYSNALASAGAISPDASAMLYQNAKDTNALVTKEDRNDRQFAAMMVATSQKIRRIRGINDATVTGDTHRVLRENMRWERARTINVSVTPQLNRKVDRDMLAGIFAIVKSSFGITNAESITITDTSTGSSWNGSDDWLQGNDGGYSERKREEELAFEQKIQNLLSDIIDLKVTATANLYKHSSWQQIEVGHGKPTSVASDEYSWKANGEGDRLGSRTGYEMQHRNTPLPNKNMVLNGTFKWNENESRDRQLSVLQGEENHKEIAPFTLRSVSASVRIPYTHFLNTWRRTRIIQGEENPEPQPGEIETWISEEIAKLKQQLLPHLRTSNEMNLEDAELERLVTIEPYHTQEMEPLTEVSTWQSLIAWLGGNWKTMGLFGLVIASLGVLWGATRPQKPEPIIIYESPELPPVEMPLREGGEDYDDDEDGSFKRTLDPFDKNSRSLQEEVSELVNENPDAAASVLRQWIGKVVPQER